MATIKDIATRLGVSVSTVSKGLNGASDISEELRQMVLDTAVEMGYATKKSKKKKHILKTENRPQLLRRPRSRKKRKKVILSKKKKKK